jgi:hypothetical protein
VATEGRFAAAARLAARQHGALATSQARATGLTEDMLRTLARDGTLEPAAPGVLRIGGSPDTWRQRLTVATLSAGPGCVVSHRAAAALHGFDRFPAGPVEVLVDRPYRSRDPRVRVHSTRRLDDEDVSLVERIPVTTAERTLIDLAASVGRNRLEEALDSGVRDGSVDVDRLRARIAALRKRGRRGIRRIESLVDGADHARPTTVLERRFLRAIVQAGLPRPDCQVPVARPDGTRAYVDFLFPGTNVAVEVDGHVAHATRRQRRHDNERANDLVLADLRVLRFTYEQVQEHMDVVSSVCAGAIHRAA